MTERRRIIELSRSAALLVASIAFSLMLLELGFRGYSRFLRPKMMELEGTLGWKHATNVRREFVNEFGERVTNALNADGHRGPVPAALPPAGATRILVLGDSFAEGWAVGETELFSALMGQSAPQLDMINAAVGGYGTVQQELYLTGHGLRYQPHVVMVMVYENDLTDNIRPNLPEFGPRPYASLVGDDIRVVDTLDRSQFTKYLLPAPFRFSLHRHSYAYYFVNRAYQRIFDARIRQMVLEDYGRMNGEAMYRILFATLDRLNSMLQARGIPLVVVQIPTREDVARGKSGTAERLLAHCSQKSLRCHSLLDRFHRETTAGRVLYFPVDIHWTKAGHAVAAEDILGYLRAQRLAGGRA